MTYGMPPGKSPRIPDAANDSPSDRQLDDESRQLALLIGSVTDYAIYMLDVDGYVRSWNPGGERIKGYAREEVIGTNFSRFYTAEDIAAGLPAEGLRIAREEGRFAAEGWRLRKDGSRFRASVVIDPIWQDGKLIGFAKITRDVTERFEAQQKLEEAQAALVHAHKLEAVGKLTLGLAHDFGNLLTIIINGLELLNAGQRTERDQRLINASLRAAERGLLLTRQLLTFGRGQSLRPEPCSINMLLLESKEMLERSCFAANVAIRYELGEVPIIEVDKAQFEAAILNLVANSRDALPSGGEIVIRTSTTEASPPAAPERAQREYVRVEVCDNGEGIPYDLQQKVFDPFFTTKEVGRGSGLGLSQVFGFAAQSGGFAQLQSVPGQGTTVTLSLPALRDTPAERQPPAE